MYSLKIIDRQFIVKVCKFLFLFIYILNVSLWSICQIVQDQCWIFSYMFSCNKKKQKMFCFSISLNLFSYGQKFSWHILSVWEFSNRYFFFNGNTIFTVLQQPSSQKCNKKVKEKNKRFEIVFHFDLWE